MMILDSGLLFWATLYTQTSQLLNKSYKPPLVGRVETANVRTRQTARHFVALLLGRGGVAFAAANNEVPRPPSAQPLQPHASRQPKPRRRRPLPTRQSRISSRSMPARGALMLMLLACR